MKIHSAKIEKLKNDPHNARVHNQKNIEAIKGSLAKFGQQKPIVIDKDNVVIAGNGTLEAAKSLGWEEIQVVVTSLDTLNKTAFALADNKTSELAEWDTSILDEQLEALKEVDFDIAAIGFEFDNNDFEFNDPGEEKNTNDKNDLTITVTFDSFDEKQMIFQELNDRGYKVK